MSIRLSKVISELNIGLQTAIDYLKKKNLGEIEDDAKPSTKITDEQYSALVAEFKGDQAVKHEAEKIFIKKAKEKKQEKVEKKALKAEELLEQRPQFKPVGKIDLDALNGKKPATPAVPKPEPEPAAPVTVEPKEAPVVEPKLKPESPKEEVQPETVAPVAEIKPVTTQQPVEPEKPAAAEEDEKSEEKSGPAIYTLKSEAKMAPKVNVLGKIDLASINQSTRPKKKTKEERRKEREEKAAQQNGERKSVSVFAAAKSVLTLRRLVTSRIRVAITARRTRAVSRIISRTVSSRAAARKRRTVLCRNHWRLTRRP